MTVRSAIFDALKGLVANRVFPDVADAGTGRPYITYQQVGGVAVNFLDPTVPSKKNYRFQVNVWDDTRASVMVLAPQVEDALRAEASLQTTVLGAPVETDDPVEKLRGSIQDFSVWF